MARFEGTDRADNIDGTAGADTILLKDGADTAHGGAGADEIHGGQGADNIYGQQGADTLFGDDGQDNLYGGDGNDILIGGAGADWLTGGAGADLFVFRTVGETQTTGREADTLYDFSQIEHDRIDLHQIDANWNVAGDQAFQFLGQHAFTHHPGELIYQPAQFGIMSVLGDTNGDGQADLYLEIWGNYTLTASDFIL